MRETGGMTLTEFLLARIAEDEDNAECIVYDEGGMNFRPYDKRWLAECEAKRRIVEVHRPLDDDPEPFCWNCDEQVWPCRTMATLAAIYADHPDYREEWPA